MKKNKFNLTQKKMEVLLAKRKLDSAIKIQAVLKEVHLTLEGKAFLSGNVQEVLPNPQMSVVLQVGVLVRAHLHNYG